jgi:hypothetical protein
VASAAQIAANRRNAQRSTGPRTPEGKARSARNGQGLVPPQLAPEGEELAEYKAFLQELYDDLLPIGLAEAAQVDRIAQGFWQSNRNVALEAGIFGADRERHGPERCLGDAFGANDAAFRHLLALERLAGRARHDGLRELMRLQAERRWAEAPETRPASMRIKATLAALQEKKCRPKPNPQAADAAGDSSNSGAAFRIAGSHSLQGPETRHCAGVEREPKPGGLAAGADPRSADEMPTLAAPREKKSTPEPNLQVADTEEDSCDSGYANRIAGYHSLRAADCDGLGPEPAPEGTDDASAGQEGAAEDEAAQREAELEAIGQRYLHALDQQARAQGRPPLPRRFSGAETVRRLLPERFGPPGGPPGGAPRLAALAAVG